MNRTRVKTESNTKRIMNFSYIPSHIIIYLFFSTSRRRDRKQIRKRKGCIKLTIKLREEEFKKQKGSRRGPMPHLRITF
jgi:hypothetical protein